MKAPGTGMSSYGSPAKFASKVTSQLMYGATPPNLTAGQAHGLVSYSEWTGVSLRYLLEEAGADPRALWILAEGADAAAMSRSVPMAKAMGEKP